MWKRGDTIFEKQPDFCQGKLIFCLVEIISFSSIFRRQLFFPVLWTCIFKCIPIDGKGFSGQWKHFFIYFSDISVSDLCRYQTYMLVISSSSGNVVLKRILSSGQRKRISWLVETIFYQYLKYAQISLPLEGVFPSLGNMFQTNPLLQSVANNLLFSGNNIFSFRFFWEPLLQLEGGQDFFTKNLISARRNRFLQFFSDTDSNGSVILVQ